MRFTTILCLLSIFSPQGVSAVGAFYELLSQSSLSILHPDENKPVAPVELCPILKTLYKILIKRFDFQLLIVQVIKRSNFFKMCFC